MVILFYYFYVIEHEEHVNFHFLLIGHHVLAIKIEKQGPKISPMRPKTYIMLGKNNVHSTMTPKTLYSTNNQH